MTLLGESITCDRERGKMLLEWSNEEGFCIWLVSEESDHGYNCE